MLLLQTTTLELRNLGLSGMVQEQTDAVSVLMSGYMWDEFLAFFIYLEKPFLFLPSPLSFACNVGMKGETYWRIFRRLRVDAKRKRGIFLYYVLKFIQD